AFFRKSRSILTCWISLRSRCSSARSETSSSGSLASPLSRAFATQRPNVASTIPRFLATSATGCPEETTYCTASALYSSVNRRLVLPTVIVSLKISVHCGHCLQDRERPNPSPPPAPQEGQATPHGGYWQHDTDAGWEWIPAGTVPKGGLYDWDQYGE